MNRREFIKRAFAIGGLTALYSLGLSGEEIKAAGLMQGMVGSASPSGGGLPANCTFYWDGDHASGTTYAYTTGVAINGTNSGGSIGTDYGVTGNGFRKTAHNQYISWTVTTAHIGAVTGTVWMKVKYSSNATTNALAFEAVMVSDPGDYMIIQTIKTNQRNAGGYKGGTLNQMVDEANSVVVDNTWSIVGYAWDSTANAHAVTDGDGTWRAVSEALDDWGANTIDRITIGERDTGGPESTTDYLLDIDDVYVFSTYQAANPFA